MAGQKITTPTTNNEAANAIFDLINQSEQFSNTKIDIILCNETPWFKGKDIATVLGYNNTKQALIDHVKNKNKSNLDNLYKGHTSRPLKGNQKNTIYINEAGLYQLIMKSKLEVAEKFQDWVTDVMLPKIRKVGQEKFIKQLEESKQKIEESKQKIEESKQQIAKLENRQLKLESFVKNIKKLEKNQFFYIATTPSYAMQSRFEYGGVAAAKDLQACKNTYNTGRAEGDLFYFTKLIKCNNYKLIEERLGSVLQQFKDKLGSRKEMIHLRYNFLVEIVDFICENYDREIEYINSRCMQFLNGTIDMNGIVPEPVDIDDYLEVRVRKNGIVKRQRIDITGWDDAKIDRLFEENINLYANEKKNMQYDFSTQKNSVALELAWTVLSSYFDVYNGLTKTAWREKFRSWYATAKPTHLRIKGIKC